MCSIGILGQLLARKQKVVQYIKNIQFHCRVIASIYII